MARDSNRRGSVMRSYVCRTVEILWRGRPTKLLIHPGSGGVEIEMPELLQSPLILTQGQVDDLREALRFASGEG